MWLCFTAVLIVLGWTTAADAKTIALLVDGVDAARVRKSVIAALGEAIDITDDKAFRACLARAGQKRPLAKELDAKSVSRVEKAAQAVGADGVVIVLLRRSAKERWALLQVVDASDGASASRRVGLDLKAHDGDGNAIATALQDDLARYLPEPEPVAPPPPTPPPAPPVTPPASPAPAPSKVEEAGRLAQGGAGGSPSAFPTSLLDVAVGVEAVGRRFRYTNGISPLAKVYNLFPGLGFGLGARAFPLRSLGRPWSDIGIAIDGTVVLLQTGQLDGALLHTVPTSYSGAFVARFHPTSTEAWILEASIGYAFTSFGSVGPPTAELPDVRYRALRPALDARMEFGRFSLAAAVAFRAILGSASASSRFYNPSGLGADAEIGAAYAVLRRLEARVTARYELYTFSFSPGPGATFAAGSALDQLFGVRASAALIF